MIDYVSFDTVGAAMDEVVNTPVDDLGYLTDQMRAEQPVILEYLCRVNDLPFAEGLVNFDEGERTYIIYIGMVVWKALRTSPRPMHPVTWEALQAAIDDLKRSIHDLLRHPDKVPDAMLLLIEDHPEPELLRFVVDALRPHEDDPSFPPIRPAYQLDVQTLFRIILTAMVNSMEDDASPII